MATALPEDRAGRRRPRRHAERVFLASGNAAPARRLEIVQQRIQRRSIWRARFS